jgi:hypothetical protein
MKYINLPRNGYLLYKNNIIFDKFIHEKSRQNRQETITLSQLFNIIRKQI